VSKTRSLNAPAMIVSTTVAAETSFFTPHRAAERQVAQAVLERGKARDRLLRHAKGGNPVGDALLTRGHSRALAGVP
jgi:N-dimethylarginine dimethylaminohydrolase